MKDSWMKKVLVVRDQIATLLFGFSQIKRLKTITHLNFIMIIRKRTFGNVSFDRRLMGKSFDIRSIKDLLSSLGHPNHCPNFI